MELSRADWAGHVAEWRQSGETATTYCEEHGLKLSSFRYWSSRIRREGPRTGQGASESSVRFASVRRKAPAAPSTHSSGVRVRVGGAEVEVAPDFDEATLARVLRVLSTKDVER